MFATMRPGDESWTTQEQEGKIDLEQLQSFIGNPVTMIQVNGVDVFLHDEGKLNGMASTLALFDEDRGDLLEILVGPLFACGHDKYGNSLPNLTEEDVARISPSHFGLVGGQLVVPALPWRRS